jgi:hypothetical protein
MEVAGFIEVRARQATSHPRLPTKNCATSASHHEGYEESTAPIQSEFVVQVQCIINSKTEPLA